MGIHGMTVAMATVAELLGAIVFFKTAKSSTRLFLSCLGLGFIIMVIIMDILPDVDLYCPKRLPMGIACCLAGAALAFCIEHLGKRWGNLAATAGIGFHNFGEGVIIAGMSALSPILVIGFLLHKVPEGMVSFSLLEGYRDRTRFLIAAGVALLIPLGALLPIPAGVQRPVMTLGVGVIFFVVCRLVGRIIADNNKSMRPVLWKYAFAAFTGAVVGGVSCVLV
jgi:ZIP family zinc transporter